MSRARAIKTPPISQPHHPSALTTPRRPRPASRGRTSHHKANTTIAKTTLANHSPLQGQLQRNHKPTEEACDQEEITVELHSAASGQEQTGVQTGRFGRKGTAGKHTPTIIPTQRPGSRLSSEGKPLAGNADDDNVSNSYNSLKGRFDSSTPSDLDPRPAPISSASLSPSLPDHSSQPEKLCDPLGAASALDFNVVSRQSFVRASDPEKAFVATKTLPVGTGDGPWSQGDIPHYLPSKSQYEVRPSPRHRFANPTPLPNVKPQLNTGDLFDCMPELITAPMPIEQRRARVRAILPELENIEDAEIPLPEPYNAAYPHPISAYASPGVNPATLYASGYDKVLKKLLSEDPDKLKGGILASAARDDVLPPALTMIFTPGEGNGIPERLWTRFESIGGARLPVGAATPGPYARVEPVVGHPDPFSPYIEADPIPPRFAGMQASKWHHHGHLTPPDRHTTGYFEFPIPHRCSTNDINTWRNELSGTKTFSVSPRGSSYRHKLSMSSYVAQHEGQWLKTEMCPIWEDTGLCKYGQACQVSRNKRYISCSNSQYAHGHAELRPLPSMVPLPTPPLDNAPLPDDCVAEGMRPYINTARKRSLPTSWAPPRLDTRRLSAPPPRDLSPVGEFDEDIAPSFWQRNYVAPVGAERFTSSTSNVSRDKYFATPQLGQHLKFRSPPNAGMPTISTNFHQLVTYPSTSSLSTAYSKIGAYTHSLGNSTSTDWSPTDPEVAFLPSVQAETQTAEAGVPSVPIWRSSERSQSASLDYSIGRSIWC